MLPVVEIKRIMESIMLENTSNTTVALSAPSSPLKHLGDGDSIISLGSPLPYLITLSVKNVLPEY